MIPGVIGMGVVGKAVHACLKEKYPLTLSHDADGSHSPIEAMLVSDVLFLCLPTPTVSGVQDKSSLFSVLSCLNDLGFKGIAVIKSTVLPGTTQSLQETVPFPLVHNPEFLSARSAQWDFRQQKTVLLGSSSVEALSKVTALYRQILPHTKILSYATPSETEMIKYVCNTFFAVKIGLFNEFYNLCNARGLSYDRVRLGALAATDWIEEQHTRVPGPDGKPGWGGACFPKDLSALAGFAQLISQGMPIVEAAIEENARLRPKENAEG